MLDNPPETISKIKQIAIEKNIKINYTTKERLDKFSGNRPNNGIILKGEKREYIPIKKFDNFLEGYIKKPEGNLLVVLDQVIL